MGFSLTKTIQLLGTPIYGNPHLGPLENIGTYTEFFCQQNEATGDMSAWHVQPRSERR